MKEFISAYDETAEVDGKVPKLDENDVPLRDAEGNVIMDDPHVRFKLDGRVLRAYNPTEGQLAFMMAAMGRGQTNDSRFASIINIMMEALGSEDKDYFEGRLLTRDPKNRLRMKEVEAIFESVVEDWFARPTQQSSDSASSEQSGTAKSSLPTSTPDGVSSENDPTVT